MASKIIYVPTTTVEEFISLTSLDKPFYQVYLLQDLNQFPNLSHTYFTMEGLVISAIHRLSMGNLLITIKQTHPLRAERIPKPHGKKANEGIHGRKLISSMNRHCSYS